MDVRTEHYEFAHRKSPRGFGSWAFSFRRAGKWDAEPVFFHQQTYGQAKRQAVAHAKATGADTVRVEP